MFPIFLLYIHKPFIIAGGGGYLLHRAAVVEHGPHVLHLPATKFAHKDRASSFRDIKHETLGVFGVLEAVAI